LIIRITAVFGDYYIGGRQFDQLETLISYYMFYSELVKDEKLLIPIVPPVVYKVERTFLSVRSHCRRSDWNNNEDNVLYFNSAGERFKVFHEVEDGEWLWAQAISSGESGLLPANSVLRVEDERLHEIEPWYYDDITKDDVRVILASVGSFSYLVRPSEQAPGNYTLFFNADVIHRYRISEVDAELSKSSCKHFQIGGRYFSKYFYFSLYFYYFLFSY